MGRPSLKQQRRDQILDAAELLLTTHGFAGLTLEKLAEHAGLARPLVRHNVGNRAEVVKALVTRFVVNSAKMTKEMITYVSRDKPLTSLIDMLFDSEYSDSNFVVLASVLTAAGSHDQEIASAMKNWTNDFVEEVYQLACTEFPEAEKQALKDTSVAVYGLYSSIESIEMTGDFSEFRESSKRTIQQLLNAL